MDPVTAAVIAALSAGAASGVTDATKKAIVDGYEGLKALIKKKFGSNSEVAQSIDKLEAKPGSAGRRQTVAEELGAAKADTDQDLIRAAHSILELIKAMPHGEQHIQAAHGIGIAQADRGGTATVNIVRPGSGKDE